MPEGRPVRTLLGFDHGQKRIGVAVGQCLTHTASSITTLKADNGQPDWDTVSRLIEEWRPDALVVGHPLRSDGSKSASTEAAERFARRLEGRYHLPVHLMDERLSSATAEDLLAGRGKTGDKAAVDALAARIILQHWLDSHRDTA